MPAGPAAVITPWNAPFMLSTWKIGAGAGGRLHGRAQAGRVVAAVLLAAGRPDGRGGLPARRVQRRCRVSARRSAPRSSRTRCSGASRSPARPRPRATSASAAAAQPRPVHRRARRQGPADRVRRRRPRRRRRQGRGPVRRRRPGVPRRNAAAGPGERSASRSSSAFNAAVDAHVLGDPRERRRRPSRR